MGLFIYKVRVMRSQGYSIDQIANRLEASVNAVKWACTLKLKGI